MDTYIRTEFKNKKLSIHLLSDYVAEDIVESLHEKYSSAEIVELSSDIYISLEVYYKILKHFDCYKCIVINKFYPNELMSLSDFVDKILINLEYYPSQGNDILLSAIGLLPLSKYELHIKTKSEYIYSLDELLKLYSIQTIFIDDSLLMEQLKSLGFHE